MKKHFTRLTSLLLALAMCTALAACGSNDASSTPATSGS